MKHIIIVMGEKKTADELIENNWQQLTNNWPKSLDLETSLIKMVIDWMQSERISFESTTFKAEWQLFEIEKEDTIDGIMTIDTDYILPTPPTSTP